MAKKTLYTIKEICTHLEEIAPISLQEGYDNAGLIIGNPNTQVSCALLTLDCTEEVLKEAKKLKCQLIIAHHPIIFGGLKKINNEHYVDRIVTYAIKNDIAIYASHTNMDNTLSGVNFQIAKNLGLKNIRPLVSKNNQLYKLYTYVPTDSINQVRKALFTAGAGQIGNYEECAFETNGIGSFKPVKNANPAIGKKNTVSKINEVKIEVILPKHKKNTVLSALTQIHPYEEVAYELIQLENRQNDIGAGAIGKLDDSLSHKALLTMISKKMKAKGIRFTNSNRKKYSKIAICGGSGAFLIKAAMNAGADAYITGDVKYHEFFESDNRMSIIDIGHYETEQYTPHLFYSILSKKMPTFALHLSKINTNPIKYF